MFSLNILQKYSYIYCCCLGILKLVRLTYLLTYLLTHSMVQCPSWEANWFAASQDTPRISRNPKVHYRTHKRPPPVSILGQPNPVHIPTSHLLEIQPNIIKLVRLQSINMPINYVRNIVRKPEIAKYFYWLTIWGYVWPKNWTKIKADMC